jgi:predicted transcriptional regulator
LKKGGGRPRVSDVSVNEILEELDNLSSEELKVIREKLDLLDENIQVTPEMLAAIDEGIRSAEEGPMIPIEEVIEEIKTWNTKSP